MDKQRSIPVFPSSDSILVEEFMQILLSDKCITYELCPEKSGSVVNLIDKVCKAQLHVMPKRHNCIDAFVCTDSPLAILKQNAGLVSIKLQSILINTNIVNLPNFPIFIFYLKLTSFI